MNAYQLGCEHANSGFQGGNPFIGDGQGRNWYQYESGKDFVQGQLAFRKRVANNPELNQENRDRLIAAADKNIAGAIANGAIDYVDEDLGREYSNRQDIDSYC